MEIHSFRVADRVGIAWSTLYIENSDFETTELLILTPYDETWAQSRESSVQDLIFGMALAAVYNEGGDIRGDWLAYSYYKDPVTVYQAYLPSRDLYFSMLGLSASAPASNVSIATWRVGENSYAIMISDMDRATITRIISTARMV